MIKALIYVFVWLFCIGLFMSFVILDHKMHVELKTFEQILAEYKKLLKEGRMQRAKERSKTKL